MIVDDAQRVPIGQVALAGLISAFTCTAYGWITALVGGPNEGPWISHAKVLLFGPLSLPNGAIFGIALWWTVRARTPRSLMAFLWLVGCSTAAWFAAVRTVFPVIDVLEGSRWLSDPVKRAVFGMPSGALGALCVAAATALLRKGLRRPLPMLSVTGVGATAAIAIVLMRDSLFGLTPLFAAWQTGVLVTIATCRAKTSPHR